MLTIEYLGVIGLVRQDANIIDISFDILSLEALFLVPRVCSLLSLHPYFGTLVTCLAIQAHTNLGLTIKVDTMPKGNGRLTPKFALADVAMLTTFTCGQTKDFVKFLGIVAILFFGRQSAEAYSAYLIHPLSKASSPHSQCLPETLSLPLKFGG